VIEVRESGSGAAIYATERTGQKYAQSLRLASRISGEISSANETEFAVKAATLERIRQRYLLGGHAWCLHEILQSAANKG